MKQLVVLLGFLFIAFSLSAQGEYEKLSFVSSQGDSLHYRLLRPETEAAGEKYPLVLFLHGAGERGYDNEKQLTHGGQMFLNPVNREKYPAFVLAPQCPPEGYWGYHQRPSSFVPEQMPIDEEMPALFATVKELLDTYIRIPQVDETRIYVMGLSMGGMATFDMACRFPETFAAAIPICGSIHPARLTQAKNVNFRIFHGDRDPVVPVECSRAAYRALKAEGANVEYIEFPGCNHDSWNPSFNYPGFMDWLFNQKKQSFATSHNDKACFVVLPDTQTYPEQYPEVLDGYFGWIIDNRQTIDAVIQMGDLTQENYPAEWWLMKSQFDRLDKANIPYTFALGNHDIGSRPMKCSDTYNTTIANRFFPLAEREQKPYWGKSADGQTIDNHYVTIKAGGMDFLIISLAFAPSDEVLEWANRVVETNQDKYVLVNTHAYLYSDSTLLSEGDKWRPQNYGLANDPGRTVNDGEGIWEKFVSQHPNIIAVFCGHILNTGVGTLVSEGKHGNKVYQMLANYQRGVKGSRMGGEGYLRVVTFDRKNKEIDVKTYSTWNKAYHPSPEHNFVFKQVGL